MDKLRIYNVQLLIKGQNIGHGSEVFLVETSSTFTPFPFQKHYSFYFIFLLSVKMGLDIDCLHKIPPPYITSVL